jgi:membrane-bound lytic murein transglycosylase A
MAVPGIRFTSKALAVLTTLAVAPSASARDVTIRIPNAHVEPLEFSAMPGWADDDHAVAFATFLKSCGAILEGTKAMRIGRPLFGGLYNACEVAKAAGPLDREQAREFFETNFKPVRVAKPGETQGFFTGYYESEVAGSREQTAEYSVPLYKIPARLLGRSRVFGGLDRSAIEDGALNGKHLEICYIKNPIDAFFAQIQGSTRIKLADGKLLRLNYIASNGMPYYPVGRYLIDRGIVAKEDMSLDRIRDWMEANPAEGKELRRKNRSFVFFTETSLKPNEECIGAQGVALTPGRSLAVDKSIHVYGTPIWIDAELPLLTEKPDVKFRRLMFAQDTGSAIVGPARADIYFGAAEGIEHVAGRIKQFGQFVMLVPRNVAVTGSGTAPEIPLPRPRPPELMVDTMPTASIAAAPLPRPKP